MLQDRRSVVKVAAHANSAEREGYFDRPKMEVCLANSEGGCSLGVFLIKTLYFFIGRRVRGVLSSLGLPSMRPQDFF